MLTETELQMLQQLMQPPTLEGLRKVLCIQPHPDDNEIGMGGIIAKLAAQGVQVDYLTVTDGALGDQGLHDPALSLADVRLREAQASGKLLGVTDFYWLGLPDAGLNDVPALADLIAARIAEGGYDAVFAPDAWAPYESHWDHIVTGRAACYAASRFAGIPGASGGGADGAAPSLRAVGLYFTANPNTMMDITEQFPLKMQAVACHASQISPAMLQVYTGYFAFRGQRLTGTEAIGEGLKVLAPLHLHCIPEAAEI